jgi:hypothetical protein
MTLFRLLLATIVATVGAYTVFVIGQHGIDFLTPFYADIAKMGWPGQYNMDFHAFLILGSLWLMWRHHFSPLGVFFGIVIFAGGAPFLCSYLLVTSVQARGDVKEMLLGKLRAGES